MKKEELHEKLQTIKRLVDECLGEIEISSSKNTNATISQKQSTTDDILHIVNKINDCEESDAIQKNVLDKRGIDARILMCFYVSHKYFDNKWLTTSDIEKITAELGVKVDKRNATNSLIGLRQYLEGGSVRKRGQPTPYRLNRKGVKKFETIIYEEG